MPSACRWMKWPTPHHGLTGRGNQNIYALRRRLPQRNCFFFIKRRAFTTFVITGMECDKGTGESRDCEGRRVCWTDLFSHRIHRKHRFLFCANLWHLWEILLPLFCANCGIREKSLPLSVQICGICEKSLPAALLCKSVASVRAPVSFTNNNLIRLSLSFRLLTLKFTKIPIFFPDTLNS